MSTMTAIDPKATVLPLLEGGKWGFVNEDPLALFKSLPIPGVKTEAWKYTRIGKLFSEPYVAAKGTVQVELPTRLPFPVTRLVFVNGCYREELSDRIEADERLTLMSWARALSEGLVGAASKTVARLEDHFFPSMNAAKASDGIWLEAQEGYQAPRPFHLLHITSGPKQLIQPRDAFFIKEGASVELIVEHVSINGKGSLVNRVMEGNVYGNLTIHKLQNETDGPFHISQESIIVGGSLKMDTTTLNGTLVRNNVHVSLFHPGAHAELNGVYLLNGTTHCDNHTYIGHDVPDCTSDELYKGIIAEKGTGVFNGKVYVKQDAQRTRAYQSNANILQGDDARIFTKPELEIYADDVKCSHGCTIGRLDEKGLFYLRSRGVSEPEARRMLSHAFMTDVLERITNEDWRKHLAGLIDAKLEAL